MTNCLPLTPDLAVLSTRISMMLDVNTNVALEVDIPYLGDDIEVILECMQVLSNSPLNVAGDYIFYQVESQIEQILEQSQMPIYDQLVTLMYIADYLEIEPLIDILAYLISQICTSNIIN